MKKLKRLNLQLFAEGAGDGSASESGASEGAEATTGVNATAVAEQKLRELGVPEDKIRKRASKYALRMPKQAESAPAVTEDTKEADTVATAPTENVNPTEETAEASVTPSRMTWEEIMADPEYNQQMQKVISKRLKTEKSAEESLAKLNPALEMLAKKYNLDPSKMDYEALSKAIEDDDEYYEEKAIEMGTSVDVAKRLEKLERSNALAKAQEERTFEDQMIQNHLKSLEDQGKILKKTFPQFDLRTELSNPAFARMTSPGVGLSVEDAYYAVHRKEIQAAETQVIAQKTAEKLSNAMQANGRRPAELGTSSQAPSVNTFDYRKATPEQRAELKKRIFAAAANGEKLYPGQ